MFEKVKHITLSGKEYPYKCDLVVLEKIQEEYSDIGDFENKISGFTPSRNEDGTIERNEEGFMLGTYGIPDLYGLPVRSGRRLRIYQIPVF